VTFHRCRDYPPEAFLFQKGLPHFRPQLRNWFVFITFRFVGRAFLRALCFTWHHKFLRLLWETLHPDAFLVEYEPSYLWLTRLWMYYVKAFHPKRDKFETDPADGAKTRELIRQHVDVVQRAAGVTELVRFR
jgi:hypothetical protein